LQAKIVCNNSLIKKIFIFMKSLYLNAYGVKEMNFREMENSTGGWWINLVAEFCTHGIHFGPFDGSGYQTEA
jgi:hypothetical protein